MLDFDETNSILSKGSLKAHFFSKAHSAGNSCELHCRFVHGTPARSKASHKFTQKLWSIEFTDMQSLERLIVPRKRSISNLSTKSKKKRLPLRCK